MSWALALGRLVLDTGQFLLHGGVIVGKPLHREWSGVLGLDTEIYDGLADPNPCEWWEAAYADHTWITRIGPGRADVAVPGRAYSGAPTSSATLPTLTLRMLDHAEIRDGHTVLDLGAGSGYSSALLAHRFGDAAVTSIDVDPYLVKAAS